MHCYIDDYNHLLIDITIIGAGGQRNICALLDTGFDGEICLSVDVAVELGLELRGKVQVELADGTRKNELMFRGKVLWDEEEKDVRIILTESEESLVGTELLDGYVLEADFAKDTLWIKKVTFSSYTPPR